MIKSTIREQAYVFVMEDDKAERKEGVSVEVGRCNRLTTQSVIELQNVYRTCKMSDQALNALDRVDVTPSGGMNTLPSHAH